MDAAIALIKSGVATDKIARAFPRAQDIGFDGVVRLSALRGGVPMSPLRKTAIAVPHDLLAAVDRAARERHESRNRFVTLVLGTRFVHAATRRSRGGSTSSSPRLTSRS
ncbi:MAG: hypothetical protein DMD83_17280, partial [Candidatus Rokuibacteriota bacterium]